MSKHAQTILLGYEIGSGKAVEIPRKHIVITGVTQEAGKTTALEGLIARSGLRAVTFITKRGESGFTNARRIAPYFREQADWQFVASILEASRSEKLKFERAWIIRASRGASTLADVQRNVRKAMETAKPGMNADVYLTLDAYLEAVVPQIAKVRWAHSLELQDGVNAVDLTHLNVEMQHLVIKSTITWVLEKEENTVVVVPEAWKFVPQGRGTPVKLAAEAFIRQAAALGNYLWLDSQDIAGIEKIILKSVPVWILGVQREANEIKRTLDNIPAGLAKPKAADIALLELGVFFACWGRHAIKTYAQPAWLPAEIARRVAGGEAIGPEDIEIYNRFAAGDGARRQPVLQRRGEFVDGALLSVTPDIPFTDPPKKKEPAAMSYDQRLAELERDNEQLREENRVLRERLDQLGNDKPAPVADTATPKGEGKVVQMGDINIDAVERALNITFSQEEREFKTTGPKGMIMFCLVHDLKNVPSGETEISAVMEERGWVYGHNTLAPELAKLVKDGDLLKEGATRGVKYRVPGKLIMTIDGKKMP